MAPAIEPREVGPGCAEGYPYYPGVPEYVNSQCPIPDDPEPLVIENAHDCSSYFLCNEGTATLECCPAGLLYDTPMQTCDDPPHVSILCPVCSHVLRALSYTRVFPLLQAGEC